MLLTMLFLINCNKIFHSINTKIHCLINNSTRESKIRIQFKIIDVTDYFDYYYKVTVSLLFSGTESIQFWNCEQVFLKKLIILISKFLIKSVKQPISRTKACILIISQFPALNSVVS